jgi:hypothetical protein
MAAQSATPQVYRRTFEDTRSRCTTDVWLSLVEHRRGRLWCWDTFVLPITNDPRLVWTTYKSIHDRNSHRLSQEETMLLWKLSREAWMSTSVTDAHWRISADNRVFSREWGAVEIEAKAVRTRWLQARRVVREYHRRITARLAKKSAMLDAVAFRSNARVDAFRAVTLRDGRQITGKMGEYHVIGTSRKHKRIYYGAATPTVTPSRVRSRLQRVNTEGFLWIVRAEDGTYTTTPRNPGLQVGMMVFAFASTNCVVRAV